MLSHLLQAIVLCKAWSTLRSSAAERFVLFWLIGKPWRLALGKIIFRPTIKKIEVFEIFSFRFHAKLLCFGFVQLRINFLSEAFRFVMRSKPNRERLDSSRVRSMLYKRAALNTPSGHLPSSHQFSKKDDDQGHNFVTWGPSAKIQRGAPIFFEHNVQLGYFSQHTNNCVCFYFFDDSVL